MREILVFFFILCGVLGNASAFTRMGATVPVTVENGAFSTGERAIVERGDTIARACRAFLGKRATNQDMKKCASTVLRASGLPDTEDAARTLQIGSTLVLPASMADDTTYKESSPKTATPVPRVLAVESDTDEVPPPSCWSGNANAFTDPCLPRVDTTKPLPVQFAELREIVYVQSKTIKSLTRDMKWARTLLNAEPWQHELGLVATSMLSDHIARYHAGDVHVPQKPSAFARWMKTEAASNQVLAVVVLLVVGFVVWDERRKKKARLKKGTQLELSF